MFAATLNQPAAATAAHHAHRPASRLVPDTGCL